MAKKIRKKKNLHLRFFLVLLAFLIETCLFIFLLFAFINYESYRFYYLIPLIVIIVLNFILGIFVFNTKVNVDYKLSWLVTILIFPFFGAILYLLFAHKITTKRRKKLMNNNIKKYLKKYKYNDNEFLNSLKEDNPEAYMIAKYIDYCGYTLYKNSEFKYFESGEKGFPIILEELKKAKRFIFMEYFIIEEGEMYNSIYEILKQKVKEGVKVIFLYDDFGTSTKIPTFYYKKVRKDGIICYPFNRISPTMNIRQNSRDHKKIIVIDGIIGFTGGSNLADEYINKINRFGYWKDNFLMIKGNAVDGFTLPFIASFYFASRKELNFEEFSFEKNKDLLKEEIKPNAYIQAYSDVPYDDEEISKNVYLRMINSAKKYIYLSTPYLVPDTELINALNNAAKSGVEVIIVTPGIPDKKLVFQITRSYYSEFLVKGIKIYEFTPGFNHEKIMIVDDKMALSGTCNFEYRSLFLHFEDCIFVSNSSEIIEMRNSFLNMVSKSTLQDINKYVNSSIFKRWILSLLRIFAPLI